jgi:hypothetical protein
VPTEDEICLFIDCMYHVKELDNFYLEKTGCATF